MKIVHSHLQTYIMAKQVFDSPDLLRLIYSFGTPEHRTFTQTLKDELQIKAINMHKYPDMQCCLDDYSICDLIDYLTTYKRCFCCTRHNDHKPIFSSGFVVIPKPSVFESHASDDCPCPCRSLSRHIIKNLCYRRYIQIYID